MRHSTRYFKATLPLIIWLSILNNAVLYAQEWQAPPLRVRTEIHPAKVLLRWIPSDAKTWEQFNKYGVRLERLTIRRAGVTIAPPEILTLADTLRPVQSNELQQLVEKYPIGGVIAQAIWGENFEVGVSGKNELLRAMALEEANTQRFLFSLYAADLCFPVAKAVGWGYEDSTVVHSERYLYRITPLVPNNEYAPTLSFVNPSEVSTFPPPIALSADFEGNTAKLSWDFNTLAALYPNYIVERSNDSIHFSEITSQPITRLGENEGTWTPISYIDSIAQNTTYFYRIAGVTPFGTQSQYSTIVSGKSYEPLRHTPLFTDVETTPDGGAMFTWTFAAEAEPLITGFDILNSPDDKKYSVIAANLSPTARTYQLAQLSERVYYKIIAKAKQGNSTESLTILVQPTDSIPPQPPVGLRASVDSTGCVRIDWEANTETDLLGYRIFRGENAEEELHPLNDEAIQLNQYTNSVGLYSLNAYVYYAVAALDKRYNQSALSARISVRRPNKISPSAPVITSVESEEDGYRIQWLIGSSTRLKAIEIYRKETTSDSMQLVARIQDSAQHEYKDKYHSTSRSVYYILRAEGENNLFSEYSSPYRVQTKTVSTKRPMVSLRLSRHELGVLVEWESEVNSPISIQLYKEDEIGKLFLLYENLPSVGTILDKNAKQGENKYFLIVKSKEQRAEIVKKSIQL